MTRVRAIPASPRVPRITRLRRQLIRRQFERDDAHLVLDSVERELRTQSPRPARTVDEIRTSCGLPSLDQALAAWKAEHPMRFEPVRSASVGSTRPGCVNHDCQDCALREFTKPYELQPEAIAIIALLCTIAGFLIGFIVHAKVIA
jgi:hypothetical protein